MPAWRVPLSDVRLSEAEVSLVADVLREGWLSQGPRVAAFEAAFASYVGAPWAVAVSSGTAALHLVLAALGVGPGDEVIVPSLTFAASAAVAVHLGAKPVFADVVDARQPWIGAETVAPLLSSRTRAVVSMSYGGHPGDVVALAALLEGSGVGVTLVEDAAHALGAWAEDCHAGTIGRAGAFSFFANKNLPLGEGGMVVTRDEELAARVRSLRSHAMTSGTWARHGGRALSYDVLEPGFNYRLDEPRAALGTALLRRFDAGQRRRAELAARYADALAGIPGIEPAVLAPGAGVRSAWHIYPVLVEDADRRDRLRASLHAAGIQTSLHYPPLHLTTGFARWARGGLPVTEDYAARTLTLPLYPTLGSEEQDAVLAALARG